MDSSTMLGVTGAAIMFAFVFVLALAKSASNADKNLEEMHASVRDRRGKVVPPQRSPIRTEQQRFADKTPKA